MSQPQLDLETVFEVNNRNLAAYYGRYLVPRSGFMWTYYVVMLAMAIWAFAPPRSTNWGAVKVFYLAMPVVLLLHEACHWLASRWMGAKDVRFGFHKLCFYAGPHQFPAAFTQMTIITLAPMVMITLLLVGLGLALPQHRMMIGFGVLLHWLCSCSDASWVNCMFVHRGRFDFTVCDLDTFTYRLVKSISQPSKASETIQMKETET